MKLDSERTNQLFQTQFQNVHRSPVNVPHIFLNITAQQQEMRNCHFLW